ncbi:MAG: DUF3500 domain-containing protein [Planctomycetaceae bacterium]|jgi:hypothetical protein|nr:DUF3500 domain-containing protein [Planctomycetaceae bacterium]MDG2388126.1 DUF3500 domain-containing protein [Planctomycetaceae bacterium]
MQNQDNCSDCGDGVSRRQFVQTLGTAAIAGSAMLNTGSLLAAGDKKKAVAETAVTELYSTLTDKQKQTMCFSFDHELRTRINANWAITKPTIGGAFYTKEQQTLIKKILQNITSEDGFQRFMKQMDEDTGGWDLNHIAIFGEPGTGKFEWELTGRHVTLRADGDSVAGAAFGGPIVYGHGEEDPAQNVFHYQTQAANEVFKALDTDQRKLALLPKSPKETQVQLQGNKPAFGGVSVGSLSSDQVELVESVIKTILAPYREADVNEALAFIKKGGGLEKLNMAFYQNGDLKNDKVWDIWRIEGPTFVTHFRGAPHVHAYINIGMKNT